MIEAVSIKNYDNNNVGRTLFIFFGMEPYPWYWSNACTWKYLIPRQNLEERNGKFWSKNVGDTIHDKIWRSLVSAIKYNNINNNSHAMKIPEREDSSTKRSRQWWFPKGTILFRNKHGNDHSGRGQYYKGISEIGVR